VSGSEHQVFGASEC